MAKQCTKIVAFYYAEQDRDSDHVVMVRNGLTEAGIQLIDIHRDGTPGRPELSQMAEMMTEAVWIVLVFTPALLENEYTLAVTAEISRLKNVRNIIAMGKEQILNLIPIWLMPISFSITDGLKWVDDVRTLIKKSPKSMDNPEHFHIPDYLIDRKTQETISRSYFSDPNPVSSEDDEDSVRIICRARKPYWKHRNSRTSLYRNPTIGFKIPIKARNLTSILQKWAWGMAQMTNVVDQHANRNDYSISINAVGVHESRNEVTFEKIRDINQSKVLFTSTFENLTSIQQSHHVNTSRESESSVLVTIDSGIIQPGILLELPSEIAADLKSDKMKITSHSNEKRIPLKWMFQSEVSIPGMETHEFSLIIDEVASTWKFMSRVDLSGAVEVTMNDLSGTKVMFLKPQISNVIQGIALVEPGNVRIKNDVVTLTNSGQMKLIYGVSQRAQMEKILSLS